MPKAPPAFVSEDSEACFKHFSPLVATTPEDALERYAADPEIVRVNIVRGLDAVRPHLDHIAKALPLVSIAELLELPSLTLALGFAANRVFTPASRLEIRARQDSLRPMRSMTLLYLEVAADLDLVPRDLVRKIRADRGPVDEARDGVAIVACFRENAKDLLNKHPFTEEALARLAEDGNWLLKQLLPSGATAEKGATNPDSLVRDRLWTEVVRRYDLLYQAGVALWGRRGVDAHIPALQSRVVTAHAAAPRKGEESEEKKPV
ncbi:MAG: hypothetical protein ABI134_09280 [Byssovorax sp.]